MAIDLLPHECCGATLCPVWRLASPRIVIATTMSGAIIITVMKGAIYMTAITVRSALKVVIALHRATVSAARAIIAPQAPPLIRAAVSAARVIIAPQAPPLIRAAPLGGSAIVADTALQAPLQA